MKTFFRVAIAALLLQPFTLVAQKNSNTFSLSGKVTATSGIPLPAASVFIPDLKTGAIADSSGNYTLTGIPEGHFLVAVNYTGYKTASKDISFHQNVSANFALEIQITEEKEIIITGVSQATSIKRLPIPATVISRKELEQTLSTNIVNALAVIPGVDAVSTGPNVSKPFIRGLGYNRVLTLFDGIRQEGQQWGDEHGAEIDGNSIERVEVIKGPASLMYGSDAVAGVINFIPQSAPPKGTQSGSVGINYQTNNNLIEGTANYQKYSGKWSYGVIGSYKMGADYQNKIDGRVYNTAFQQSALYANATLHKNWGYSKMELSFFNDLQEIPDGTRDSATRKFEKQLPDGQYQIVTPGELRSYSISAEHQLVQHVNIYNISNFSLGSGRMTTQLGYQKSIRKEFESEDPGEPGLFLNLNMVSYDIKYLFHDLGNLNLTAGINGFYKSNVVDKGFEFLIPSYKQNNFGPFIFGKWTHNKLTLAGGLRWDLSEINTQQLYVQQSNDKMKPVYGADTAGATLLFPVFQHTFTGATGSMGMTYQIDQKWSAKMNIARGFRSPNIAEISSNGIHSGSQIYQLGQNNFKPELNLQEDAGLNFDSRHLSASLSIFNNRIQNFIYNRRLNSIAGGDSVIVPGFETFQFAASRANLWGAEFSSDLHPHPLDWLHIENSLSFVFARNLGNSDQKISSEEKYLPFIPPLHCRSNLRVNFPEVDALKDFFANFEMNVYAAQNRIFSENNTETPTPGYTLFDAGIGASIKNRNGKPAVIISLLASNLLNKAYQSNMSRLKYFEEYPTDPRGHYGIYNMGRNIALKLTIPFAS